MVGKHLEHFSLPAYQEIHLDKYMTLVKAHGWLIQLPWLVSQSRSQLPSEADGVQVAKFDQEMFQQYLLNFVIMNDQVCIYFAIL